MDIIDHDDSDFNSVYDREKALDVGLVVYQTQQGYLHNTKDCEKEYETLPDKEKEMYILMGESAYLLGIIEMQAKMERWYKSATESLFSRYRLLERKIEPEYYAEQDAKAAAYLAKKEAEGVIE